MLKKMLCHRHLLACQRAKDREKEQENKAKIRFSSSIPLFLVKESP